MRIRGRPGQTLFLTVSVSKTSLAASGPVLVSKFSEEASASRAPTQTGQVERDGKAYRQ
jgi:hypothetical protein